MRTLECMVTHTQSDYSNSRAHANRALMNVALYHTHTGMSMRVTHGMVGLMNCACVQGQQLILHHSACIIYFIGSHFMPSMPMLPRLYILHLRCFLSVLRCRTSLSTNAIIHSIRWLLRNYLSTLELAQAPMGVPLARPKKRCGAVIQKQSNIL